MNLNFETIKDDYKAESDELLEKIEESLFLIQKSGYTQEDISTIFRAVHTIKGSSAMFGLDHITSFTHGLENLLEKLRNGSLIIDGNIIELIFKSKDLLVKLIDFALMNKTPLDEILDLKEQYLKNFENINSFSIKVINESISKDLIVIEEESNSKTTKHISIRAANYAIENGMDPLSIIEFLKENGTILSIITITDDIPPFLQLNPIKCYLGFEICYKTFLNDEKLMSIFEFIQTDSKIYIFDENSSKDLFYEWRDDLDEDEDKLFSYLKMCGLITENPFLKQENIETTQNTVIPISVTKEYKTLRVDSSKVDKLINLIGEMVISTSNVSQIANSIENRALLESISTLNRVVEDIRNSAMKIRMIPIGDSFNRFRRVVIDLAKELGKEIKLEIEGGDTELDKSVIEKINEPLLHIIRNCIDHGIESPKDRETVYKKHEGKILLKAYYEASNIVIQISDDGRGIDHNKLIKKALEKKIIDPHMKLSKIDAYNLLFLNGFSTADNITNISGRGVGMDVVKKNIEDLRGFVSIESEINIGTTIKITLPLTLAIIDGFLIEVSGNRFIIALDNVVECIELKSNLYDEIEKNSYINYRREILPIISLNELFGYKKSNQNRENIVIVKFATGKLGFLVDKAYGEVQTVVKPLGRIFKNIKGISGATILGSGEIVLILDIASLFSYAQEKVALDR